MKTKTILKTTFLFTLLIFLLKSCGPHYNKTIDLADRIEVISYKSVHECDSTKDDESVKLEHAEPKCIEEKIVLSKEEFIDIKKVLFEHAILKGSCEVNDCYEPRHSVLFYKDNKRIAYVDICFVCAQSRGERIGCLTFKRSKEIQTYFKSLGIKYGLKE